ncbi:MAG: hypothetical protein SNF93_03295 [Rikenellaceae bacterium]
MEITKIENIIATNAQKSGYTPLIVSEEGLEKGITTFPTAWIQLPLVLSVEGRDQGVITHKITVALLDDYSAYSFEDKNSRLAEMQEDMLEIMTAISCQEGIVELNEVSVTPRLTHTTRHGDVAQICQAKIVSYF